MNEFKKFFKTNFVTGILVIAPIMTTFWFAQIVFSWVDNLFPTQQVFGRSIPGFGILVTLTLIVLSGLLVRNFLGNYFVSIISTTIQKVPFLGSIYSSLKQLFSTMLNNSQEKFGQPVLVEYPRKESWTIAFLTSKTVPLYISQISTQKLYCLYVPTTPNPTSGFFIFVPDKDIKLLNISVDEAFKLVISLGLTGKDSK